MKKISKIIILSQISMLSGIAYAQKPLKCEHHFTETRFGMSVEMCYAKNYNTYSSKEAINEFLSDQVYVEGGEFKNIKTGQTIKIQGFYMEKYLAPFQEYNAYLRDTGQWHDGEIENQGKARLRKERYNGLYPAKADYQNAIGFCYWLGKKTGLDISLPTYSQWMYAATSRGTNWQYPTEDGQLKLGENYYQYTEEDNKNNMINTLVDQPPVNSLGIYQFFGNGRQMTKASSDNRVTTVGTPLTWPEKIIEDTKLSSGGYTMSGPISEVTGEGVDGVFRCVINTDKPIPKNMTNLKN